MVKLTILFPKTADEGAFEERFSGRFLPEAEKLPGLVRSEITRVLGAPGSVEAGFHLQYEWYFDDLAALEAAMVSPAGQAVARQVESFGREWVQMFYGEAYEMHHREETRETS